MACGSIAVSKAQIAQVAIEKEQLTAMLAKLLGITADEVSYYQAQTGDVVKTHGGKKLKLAYDYSHAKYYGYKYPSITGISIVQRITADKVTIELLITGNSDARAQELKQELEQAFDRQLTVAQQSTVLKKLAALGKLSSITQKDNGVTARLEITI